MKRTNLITVVNERLTDHTKEQNPYGWWVNLNTGRTIDISSDSGGGHHIGYIWLTHEPEIAKLDFNLDEFDLGNIDRYFHSYDSEMSPELLEAFAEIYTDWFRVAYWDAKSDDMPGGSLMITVADRSSSTYQAVMKFLLSFIDEHLVINIWVDTYTDDPIWGGITPEDVLFTKNFGSGVWYGAKESIDPQLVADTFVKQYGQTSYPEQAGWLTPDGRMIYMGRDEDQYDDETAFITHSDTIWNLSELGDDYRDLSLFELQSEGFIRCYGQHGIELAKQPTWKQLVALRAMLRHSAKTGNTFFVDVTDGRKIIDYCQYGVPTWTVASIIERIMDYPYLIK